MYAGAVTQTEQGILSGSSVLTFPEHMDVSTGALEFSRGIRLSEGLRQGRSYVVHAVAEDANSPDPNRRTRFCSTASNAIAPGGKLIAELQAGMHFCVARKDACQGVHGREQKSSLYDRESV